MPDTLVEVLSGDGSVLASGTSTFDGSYQVTVAAGTYDVRFTPPALSGYGTLIVRARDLSASSTLDVQVVPGGPAVKLSGVVRNRFDVPIRARVGVYNPTTQVGTSVNTAADGSYELTVSPGTYQVTLYSDSSAPAQPSMPNVNWAIGGSNASPLNLTSNTVQDFKLQTIAVQVTTVGPSGNPIPNTVIQTDGASTAGTVHLFPGDNAASSFTSQNTTDANGQTTVNIFPSTGTTTTRANPPAGSGFSLVNTTALQGITADTSKQIVLPAGVKLSGVVRNRFDVPIRARVGVYNPTTQVGTSVNTAADGSYELTVSPGTYQVTLYSDSSAPAQPSMPNVNWAIGGSNASPLNLTSNTVQDFKLQTIAVQVTTVGPSGNPIPNTVIQTDGASTAGTVHLFPGDNAASSFTSQNTTDANGQTTVNIFPSTGTTTTRANPPAGSGFSLVNTTALQGITADTSKQIVLPAGVKLSGVVRNRFDVPIRARVGVYNPTTQVGTSVNTAADGSYELTVSPGTYQVTLYSDSSAPAQPSMPNVNWAIGGSNASPLNLTSNTVQDFKLQTIAVQVTTVGPSGNPIPNTVIQTDGASTAGTVHLFPGDNAASSFTSQNTTDANGQTTVNIFPSTGTTTTRANPPTKTTLPRTTFSLGGITSDQSVVLAFQQSASDAFGPSVSCDPAPPAWSTSDVTRSCTASDGGSGLANPADATFSLSTSVASGAETADAPTGTKVVCDLADNCTTAGPLAGNKVDRRAPSVSFQTPVNGASVTKDTPLTLAFQCADGGSGVATCTGTPANGSTLDTGTLGQHQISVTTTDDVGNSATRTATYTVTAPTDGTGPQVSCAPAPTTWSTTDVTRACTASDPGSGLANAGDASFSLSTSVANGTESSNALTGSKVVCDLAANCTTAGPLGGNKVDKKAPTVTFQAPADGATLARFASVTVAFQCADGGSGVATCSGTPANGAALDTSTPGPHQISVSVSDELGNSATRTANYTVSAGSDVTKPQISCDAAPAAWSTSNVTRTCTASDSESGLANAGDASFTLSTTVPSGSESSNAQTATKQVCDADGNCATAGPLGGNKVDRKAPEVTFLTPTNGASVTPGTPLTLAFQCTDAGSGVATCTGTPANGSTLDTTTLGPHEIKVAVTDQLGNTATRVGVYVVQDPPQTGGGGGGGSGGGGSSGGGTYEINSPASGTSGISASSSLPPGSELPVPGESTSAAGGGGIVYVYLTSNGKTKPVRLTTSSSTVISNGARVNATGGTVVIIVATSTPGVFTTAEVSGGEFTVEVKPNGVTILRLSAVLDGCPNFGTQKASTKKKKTKKTKTKKKKTTKRKASTAGKKNTPKKQGRRSRTLRVSDDGGKIETWGRYAVGAPAGTTWTTTDTCDSTTIKVIEGRVRVTPLQGDPVSIVPAPKSRTVRAK